MCCDAGCGCLAAGFRDIGVLGWVGLLFHKNSYLLLTMDCFSSCVYGYARMLGVGWWELWLTVLLEPV
jgi:hypothetical protein